MSLSPRKTHECPRRQAARARLSDPEAATTQTRLMWRSTVLRAIMRAMSAPRLGSRILGLGLVLLASSTCVPDYARVLRVPFEIVEKRHVTAVAERPDGGERSETTLPQLILVDVPLRDIFGRWRDFEYEQAAFYQGGSTPLPHRPIDTDGDEIVDAIRVPLRLHGDAPKWLFVVSPASAQSAENLPDAPLDRYVEFDFAAARR